MTRLRLVRVQVVPEFVADDGENLSPVPVEPITVSAAEWPDYAATFEAARQALEASLNEPPSTDG